MSFSVSGAGGYGAPFERDPDRVLRDVIRGYVSIQGGREDYGVVIDPETMTVDSEETNKLRHNRRKDDE